MMYDLENTLVLKKLNAQNVSDDYSQL